MSSISNFISGAKFVTHAGFTTMMLVITSVFLVIMLASVEDNRVTHQSASCRFEGFEPSDDRVATTLNCTNGGETFKATTLSLRFLAWVIPHRSDDLVCTILHDNKVSSCVKAS